MSTKTFVYNYTSHDLDNAKLMDLRTVVVRAIDEYNALPKVWKAIKEKPFPGRDSKEFKAFCDNLSRPMLVETASIVCALKLGQKDVQFINGFWHCYH